MKEVFVAKIHDRFNICTREQGQRGLEAFVEERM
jgi:hypothetical protein